MSGSRLIAAIVIAIHLSFGFFLLGAAADLPSSCEDYQEWSGSHLECYDPAEFRSTIDTLQQTQGTNQVAASQVAAITDSNSRLVVYAAAEGGYYCWREQVTDYCSTKKGDTQ